MEEAYLEYNHMVIRYQGNLNLIKDLDGCDVLGKSNLFLLERWSGNSTIRCCFCRRISFLWIFRTK